jgi:hypothetical protein
MAEKEPTKIVEMQMTLKDKEREAGYAGEIERLRTEHLSHSFS